MSVIASIRADELYQEYLEDPANVALRSALIDLLTELGDEERIETINKEWEPRAWLIAKGRKPYEDKHGWYYFVADSSNWRPFIKARCLVPGPLSLGAFISTEKCIRKLCLLWDECTEKQKQKFWNWNPPT